MLLRFDEFELDTATYALRTGDETIRVEPRVFELLAFLLRERHRLVAKDELVEAVWQGQVVGDTALSRCVYMARQALGDDSSQQRYIKTVHGRGYRFSDVVAVHEVDQEAAAEPDALAPGDSDVSDGPVEAKSPAAASSGREEVQGGQAEGTTYRHRWAMSGALLALVTVVLVGIFAPGAKRHARDDQASVPSPPVDRLDPAAKAPERAGPVGVLWSATSNHPEAALTALSLTDLLVHRLEEIEGLVVRDLRGEDAAALTDRDSLASAFAATGSQLLLIGEVSDSSATDRFAASAELYRLEGTTLIGSPLGQFELPRLGATADLDAFIRTRERIAARLARSLGLLANLTPEDPLDPTDAEAYRLFLLAQQTILADFCGSSAAVGLLERSLELDPDFVLGWELLAVAHYNLGWACGAEASALEAFHQAAEEVSVRAPERPGVHLLTMDLLAETGRAEDAWARREASAFLDPSQPEVIASELYVLTFAGFLEEAAARIGRLIEVEPIYYAGGQAGESPNALLYLGDLDAFERILPFFDTAYHRFYQGFAALRRGDSAAAKVALEPAFRANPGSVFGRLSQGLLAAVEGDDEGAGVIIEQLARQRRELDSVDAEITYKQAQILALAGDHAGALDNLARTVEGGFFAYRAFREDPLLADLEGDARFEAILLEARERHLAFAERFGLAPDLGTTDLDP